MNYFRYRFQFTMENNDEVGQSFVLDKEDEESMEESSVSSEEGRYTFLALNLVFFGPNLWPKLFLFWPKSLTFLAQIIVFLAQIITFLAQITTFLVHF